MDIARQDYSEYIKITADINKNIVIIGPKSSKKALYDDIKKLNFDSSRVQFFTFAKIKKTI